MKTINLVKVHYLPKQLEEGYLYVSEEFGVAGHLCACGCKSKVITPLEPSEWAFTEINDKPSLYPSIGNWQLPCRSHYWITEGEVEWSYQWSKEQIAKGNLAEQENRKLYYDSQHRPNKKISFAKRFINFILSKLSFWRTKKS